MPGRVIRCDCPHCSRAVVQVANMSDPNVCPHCFKVFPTPTPKKTPSWVFGVLVVLAANLLIAL